MSSFRTLTFFLGVIHIWYSNGAKNDAITNDGVEDALPPSTLTSFPPTEYTFDQRIDHFRPGSKETFKQRYLVYDDFAANTNEPFPSQPTPILFYLGGEGQIEGFYEATSILFSSIGREMKALIVFLEHRDYGKSHVLSKRTKEKRTGVIKDDLRYLTIDQALADFAFFIDSFKKTIHPKMKNSPVLLFGGSYGGMLVSWFRIKYPHLSDGGVVSSGPVDFNFQVGSSQVQRQFWASVLHTFRRMGGQSCVNAIEKGLSDLKSIVPYSNQQAQELIAKGRRTTTSSKTTVTGLTLSGSLVLTDPETLQQLFGTCTAPSNVGAFKRALIQYIKGALASLAMVNYPYKHKLVTTLPGLPVQKVCDDFLTNVSDGSTNSRHEVDIADITEDAQAHAYLERQIAKRLIALNQTVNFYIGDNVDCKDVEKELVVFERGSNGKNQRSGNKESGKNVAASRDKRELTPPEEKRESSSDVLEMENWNYQACSEIAMQGLTTDYLGFYPVSQTGIKELEQACLKRYGVHPGMQEGGTNSLVLKYGLGIRDAGSGRYGNNDPESPAARSRQRNGLTKVIVIDGEFDPWNAGRLVPPPMEGTGEKEFPCVPINSGSAAVDIHACRDVVRDVVYIPPVKDAAHHQDLVAEHAKDSEELKLARKLILGQLKVWVGQESEESGQESKEGNQKAGKLEEMGKAEEMREEQQVENVDMRNVELFE